MKKISSEQDVSNSKSPLELGRAEVESYRTGPIVVDVAVAGGCQGRTSLPRASVCSGWRQNADLRPCVKEELPPRVTVEEVQQVVSVAGGSSHYR